MKKQSKAILSLALCLAVIMSVFTVVPVSATENANSTPTPNILADFENGINTFPVIDNIYSGAHHRSLDSTMIDFSSAEEALNGVASLKVNVPEGNTRTEVLFAESKLTDGTPTYKYNVSNSDDGGMFFRLKINNDVSTAGHKFAVLLSQSGVAKNTFLASGAVLYDLEGNEISTTSTSLQAVIPSNFDGFVYLPFATARSEHACTAGSYDNYIDNPDCMVKLTENYKISFMFGNWGGGDTSWDNTEVLLDDICIIGSEDGAAWNTMRALGYENVLYAVQPEKYTLPVTHEDLMQPIQSFQVIKLNENATDYTYSISASLTNDADEVLLGNISAKISTETVNGGTTDGVIESFRTNTITFEGIEALSTEKIVAAASDNYAYFKMRIKVPTNEANGTYNIWPVIKQGNNCYRFEFNGSAYNADGTKNNNVPFAKNKAIQLPSGFDGYIYMPVWSLRDTDWNLGQRSTTAYQTKNYTDPALDSDFDFFIHFAQNGYNLDNAEIIIDDMGFVMGDYTGFTFEDGMINVTPAAKGYTSQGWKEVSLDNISRITGENALNGNASILLDIEDVYSVADDGTINYHSYNAAVFAMDGIAEGRADGVMLRMKLLDDPSTGTAKSAHQMYLMFGKKNVYADTCVGGKSIKLYHANGKPLDSTAYVTDDKGVYVPSGFDGYVFFPLDVLNYRLSNSTLELVDITDSFNMYVWFQSPKFWAGVDVLLDDIAYYTVADSTVGLTDTDAKNAINSCGYSVHWIEQPDVYDLSVDYEDFITPMDGMVSRYGQLNGDGKYPNATIASDFVTGNEALSGDVSLKYSISKFFAYENAGRKFVRATSTESAFNGIEGLDKESIANNAENYAYLTMRVKVPIGAEDGGYQFNVYVAQDGVDKNTRLRPSYGYTTDGEYVKFTVKDGVTTLPAGFDGTIYMPFKKATSESTLATGVRAMYGNSYTKEDGTILYGNDYMVDFSQQFDMYLYLYDADWADTVLYVDDIQVKQFERADFDNSGSVDATDVVAISQYIIGANTTASDAYDLNGDGYINVIDVVRIKRIIAGLV